MVDSQLTYFEKYIKNINEIISILPKKLGIEFESQDIMLNEIEFSSSKLFYIDNGWVKYDDDTIEKGIIRYYERDKKAYHGDITLDIIKKISDIQNEDINLINVYEKSYITGEPKVEKQSSLERVYQLAKAGDVLLMNMELYREANDESDSKNIPITSDPASLKIVNQLIDNGVICIFPAGNSCIDLMDIVVKPKNYILAGALSGSDENWDSYGSNYLDDIYYVGIPQTGILGLYDSSAAAAIATGICLAMRKSELGINTTNFMSNFNYIANNLQNYDKENILKNAVEDNNQNIIKYSRLQYKKWYDEFTRCPTDDDDIKNLSKLISPINRNIFPYPRRITFNEFDVDTKNYKIDNFYTEAPNNDIRKILKYFKEKEKYLGLKVCFGVNEDGNIQLIISGFCKKDVIDFKKSTLEEIKIHFENSQVDVSKESFYVNFEERTSIQEKKFLISEFKRYFKVETHGFVISINLLETILNKVYDFEANSKKALKVMVVTDSRKMKDSDTPDQEFGIVISDLQGRNPICFIKDRVLNQAISCPPLKPCV